LVNDGDGQIFYDDRSGGSMAERYPRRFGKYLLLKPLARGGMGQIYVAATGERGFQKFCVIKKVIAEKTDRGKANRFLDEAQVALRLSHANLVPTFDAGEVDGEFYIAMELVEGKDLREIWNRCVRTRTRIPLDVALHVAREIARALAYVHSYGDLSLVHRDVAPPNILLSFFGEVKLTDFGLARSVLKQEHTAPGVVFGRASYLAPEQARGETADARTDVYSLGIVLWELLTGHQYLQLANLDAATAMSLVRHPRPLAPSAKAPWVTPDLDAVVMRALAPEREYRFETAEQMRQALSDVIARTSPRVDAERAADFLRTLYGTTAREEREERERLLAESASAPEQPARGLDGDEPTPLWRRSPSSSSPVSAPISGPVSGPVGSPGAAPAPLGFDFTGRVIDNRYRILRKIGEGGMGTVYAGEHVEIGKAVAVKVLHPAYSRQQDLVERFRREARAASRVGHPNIIDVTDFGATEDGYAYFVMEQLDGIDLADVLSHERLIDPARACQIAVQICRALHAAHAAGVIHRDLKPENIFLVARDGQADFVKVLDFGIARSVSQGSRRLTNPGIAMGTPEYMAPEQASGSLVDRRSDIYSVGALLYEMVTATTPYASAAAADRAHEPPQPPREIQPGVSEELGKIIMQALAPNPDERYQTMAQLEYDLTKSVWGRPRAVAELLGLREPDGRLEDSGGVRDRRSGPHPGSGPTGEGAVRASTTPAPAGPAAAASPAGPAFEPTLVAPAIVAGAAPPAESAEPAPPSYRRRPSEEASLASLRAAVTSTPPPPAGSDTLRFFGTFALLALSAVAATVVYRQLPWSRPGPLAAVAAPRPAPAAPTEAQRRAARAQGLVNEIERMLEGPPALDFARLAPLEDRLARLRREGGGAAATRLSAGAARALERAAQAELDRGDVEAGTAHYKLALGMDPAGRQGQEHLALALRARAEAALAAKRPADAARWAREVVALEAADPDAHALLGAALLASGSYAAAADEYSHALASRPRDPALKRGLARARRRADAPAARAARKPAPP
jgi:serine/threonine protein kinase